MKNYINIILHKIKVIINIYFLLFVFYLQLLLINYGPYKLNLFYIIELLLFFYLMYIS